MHRSLPAFAENLDRLARQGAPDHVANQSHVRTGQRLRGPKGISEAKTDDGKSVPLCCDPIMMLGGGLVHALNVQGDQRVRLVDGTLRHPAVLMRGAEIDLSPRTRLRQGADDDQMGSEIER